MTTEARKQRSATSPSTREHEALAHDQPLEDAQKSYHTVLEQHVQQATEDLERPARGLFLSSVSAGLDVGFGPFLMAVIGTLTLGAVSHPARELLIALTYTIGFVFVVIGRSALFTEQTTSAVLPVLAQRASVAQLLRLWAIVLVGNIAGATLIAAFISQLAPALHIVRPEVFGEIAMKLTGHSSMSILGSAIAAGWLMGLLAWLVVASRDTMSQVTLVIATTFVIGIAGLHHSIAGTIEVLMALFASAGPTWTDFGKFLFWAVLGNAIGGVVFVALLKFGHVRASLKSESRT